MTIDLRDDPEPDYGEGCVLGCFIAGLLGCLLWAGIVWLYLWLAQGPAVFRLRVGALVLLLVGTGLVFWGLLGIERGESPSKEVLSVRSTDATCGAPGRGLGATPAPGLGGRR